MAVAQLALNRLRRTQGSDLLPNALLLQMLDQLGVVFRDRLLNPVDMLRLFRLQVLCRNVAITALRQLSNIDFSPSSYCQARQKLSLRFVRHLIGWTITQSQALVIFSPCGWSR